MAETAATPVLFERRGNVAIVTLNRPKARNAVNGEVSRIIAGLVREIEGDASLRVAVFTSSSPVAFCAGADLAEIAAGRAADISAAEGGFGGFVKAQRRKPWIAAVAGWAMGGGFELVLAADMVVVGESAKFGLPEALRGLTAGAGGMFRLPRAVPRAVAIEVMTAGRVLTAAEALDFGLANRLVPDAELLSTALALAQRVADAAPLAVHESLALARIAQDHDEAELWRLSSGVSARIIASNDAREGAAAFIGKRNPVWTGS